MREGRRTIAFVGNCQAQVLSRIYRRRVATLLNQSVIDIRIPLTNSPGKRPIRLQDLENVDIVVEQKFDAPDVIPPGFFDGKQTLHIRFPYVNGRLYWPYGGAAHPSYAETKGGASVPYDAELGDSLLNQMIAEQVPADEALRRYDAAIAGGTSRIRRIAELLLERQRARDAACGMQFTDFIAANYQKEALFTTQGHPNLTMLRMLVEQVLLALQVPYSLVDAAVRSLRPGLFPHSELPIHPGVAEVLGLTFVTPGHRFLFQREGTFTFEEYARRYLACTWEPEWERGQTRLNAGEPEAAVRLMQSVLRRCEGTSAAWRLLAQALSQLGQDQAADEASAMAIRRDPADPDAHASHAQILNRRREFAAAEAAARRAIELAPFGVVGHRTLALVLSGQGRHVEALAVARMLASAEPGDPRVLGTLAHHLTLAHEWPEAVAVLRRAVAMDPADAVVRRQLAGAEARLGEIAGAPDRLPARRLGRPGRRQEEQPGAVGRVA